MSSQEHFEIADKVQSLGDLELATLICLVAEQHCIIEAEEELIDDVEAELKLVAANIFGLTWATLSCDQHTTLDTFGSGILVKHGADPYFKDQDRNSNQFSLPPGTPKTPDRRLSKPPGLLSPFDSRQIANVVIVKNLNQASTEVQVQALELLRGKRNFTRTAVHAAPRPFLFISLNASGTQPLMSHLNDEFLISHKHQAEDGLPNLEELQDQHLVSEDDASTSSVVRKSTYTAVTKPQAVLFPAEDLAHLIKLTASVKISSEVRAYLHNIVVFMRLHRAVARGISAMATRHFNTLAHVLAPLHNLEYVSPSLVALAARKIYPHRIVITTPENERSMQWGGSLDAVKAVLEGVTVEDVVEEVLQSVEVPL
ncbi:hypothetical protein T440DRAFT_175715 [Plenodomus tracheiphilus IPT5]|uniref:magnesium chelatase n=1 Tax=Plenodomus tracheiphilus IPT5 TaxID=1408161 RepID=A0A6A7AY72_9PLEO|nr:hypothetical protein T440DRAFT_175715 [Plenodomus tracheiphilus IPT5]